MKSTKFASLGYCCAAIVATFIFTEGSIAQVTAPGFKSKPMIVAPITGVEGKEVAIIDVTIEVGGSSPRHTHPGDCYGAIVEGTVELVVDGKDPQQFTAGQSWNNPPGPVHSFKNVGDKPVRMINTLVVEKGKPRTVVEKPAGQ